MLANDDTGNADDQVRDEQCLCAYCYAVLPTFDLPPNNPRYELKTGEGISDVLKFKEFEWDFVQEDLKLGIYSSFHFIDEFKVRQLVIRIHKVRSLQNKRPHYYIAERRIS